jgi:hypothetical protein
MKTATGLGLLATGAILVFALRASPPGLDIHAVGWILMAAAVAGLLLPSRNRGWIRQVTVRRRPGTAVRRPGPGGAGGGPGAGRQDDEHLPYPPYVLRDPAALASAILRDAELGGPAPRGDEATTRPYLRAVTEEDVANG